MTTILASRYLTTEVRFFEMSNTINTNTVSSVSDIAMAATLSLSLLPPDAYAKKQAELAFADDKLGNAKIGQATQRMVFAVHLHDANLLRDKKNTSPLKDFLTRDRSGKPTADSNTIRDVMVDYLAGDKPDTKDLSDNDKLAVTKAYTAKTALVKRALEIAAYRDANGLGWKDFDTKTNTLLVKGSMLHPRGSKAVGRIASERDDKGKLIEPELIALNGRSVSYVIVPKSGGETTRNAQATIAHMLSCVRPASKPKVTGGTQSEATKATIKTHAVDILKAVKPIELANNVQLPTLMTAIHVLLCGNNKANGKKEGPTAPLVGTDYTNGFWNEVTDVLRTLHEAAHSPAFKKRVNGENPHKAAIALAEQAVA